MGRPAISALLAGCCSLCLCHLTCCASRDLQPVGRRSPELQASLSTALACEFARLGIDPQKVPSAAPQGADNFVFNLEGAVLDTDGAGPQPPLSIALAWTERAVGDYDQNGEVNIGDLTPLGQRLHAVVSYQPSVGPVTWWPAGSYTDDGGAGAGNPPVAGSGAANWRLARIDGDGNGELNISDITPIATHWQQRISGYRVYCKPPGQLLYTMLPNPDDAGSPVSVEHPAPDATRPVVYPFGHVAVVPGIYEYYVVPFDSESQSEGVPSNHVALNFVNGGGPVNQPPTAVLAPSPNSGDAPLGVTWDASASYDTDGNIANYEWDRDANGTYEAADGNAPTLDMIYMVGGWKQVGVRVTDDQGAQSEAVASLYVGFGSSGNQAPVASLTANPPSGELPLTVTWDASASSDPDNNIGEYHWDLDYDGFPELTTTVPSAERHYIYPGTFTASVHVYDTEGLPSNLATAQVEVLPASGAYWHVQTIAPLVYPANIQLELIGGSPAIAWWDDGHDRTSYVRALDGQGQNWAAPVDVTSYRFAALAEVQGSPALALINPGPGGSGSLNYTRADNGEGSTWTGAVLQLEQSALVFYSSVDMLVVSGAPAIAYFDEVAVHLKYIRAADDVGSSWGPAQVVNNSDFPYLLMVNNQPAVFCSAGSLWYSRASDAFGDWPGAWSGAGSIFLVLDPYARMARPALIAGMPAACYRCENPLSLRYIRASDADGSVWDTPVELLGGLTGAPDLRPSLIGLAGKPGLFFNDPTTSTLVFLRGTDAATFAPDPAETIDASAFSLAGLNVNGVPAVAYSHGTDLEFAAYY